MDKNEMTAVLGALERINRSLDERFEKDADLYIAPEQVEKLKHLICLGNYLQIVKECTLKKYSANVLANVLIKNAWLMRNNRYNLLQPIFDECDYSYLQNIMRDGVFDNKIEMPSEFRLQLIATFLEKGEPLMCRQILGQKLLFLNHPMLKAICVRQALKDEPIINRYRLFNEYVKQNKNILTREDKVAKLFPAKDFTDNLRAQIFEDQIKQATDATYFWLNRLGAADILFMMEQYKKFCRLNSSNLNECKNVFGRLQILYKNDFETFAKKFAEACTCMDGNRKERLAHSFLNRIQNKDEEQFLRDALDDYNIILEEKGTLANIEEIARRLTTDADYQYRKAVGYLTASFDKKYYSDYENNLNQIYRLVPLSRFEDFCLNLVKFKHWHLGYLLYAIKHLVPTGANKNNPIVSELLEYIRDKDILRTNKYNSNIGEIIEFVKTKDFDLFTRLKQF